MDFALVAFVELTGIPNGRWTEAHEQGAGVCLHSYRTYGAISPFLAWLPRVTLRFTLGYSRPSLRQELRLPFGSKANARGMGREEPFMRLPRRPAPLPGGAGQAAEKLDSDMRCNKGTAGCPLGPGPITSIEGIGL